MDNITYLNNQLYHLSSEQPEKNNNLEELPYTYDQTKYMFQIQLKVYTPLKIMKSVFPLSPHMVLIGYLQGKTVATMMYKDVSRSFNNISIDTTASLLADMVTPNLQPNVWIKDLEHNGYLITPLYLTRSEMRKIIHEEGNKNMDAVQFCHTVTACPKLYDFIPYLDTTRIDPNNVYVTDHIKNCHTPTEKTKKEEKISYLEIR